MSAHDSLYIGIDGGGTKTELLAKQPGDNRTIQRLGEGSNLQLVGLQESAALLADMILEARKAAGDTTVGHICVGLSGAGRPHEQEAIARAITEELELERSRLQVVSDAEIAVEAAFEGESGVLVIAGTGSMVCGRTLTGEFISAGGWGRLLGDEGSGYVIGRAGLRAVAAAMDGGPETQLVARAREIFGEVSKAVLVEQVYGKEWPLQEFAPHVLEAVEAGDAEAVRILRDQTRQLARRVQWLIEGRSDSITRRLAMIGGLSNAPTYRSVFKRALESITTDWQIERSIARPAVGALRMALSAGGFSRRNYL
jgi:N-acetylglucosamine kinase-like BadF-type ATPase